MKKIFSLILCTFLILSLFSCSKEKQKDTSDEFKNATDIASMSGDELYAYSLSQKKKTAGAELEIKETSDIGGVQKEMITAILADTDKRDEYFYSQSNDERAISYFSGKVYISEGGNRFSSDMSIDDFTEYLSENFGDKWYFGDAFGSCERNGNELSFGGAENKKLLSLISGISEDMIKDASGKASLNDEYIIESADFTISGDNSNYNISIKLQKSGDGAVSPAAPEGDYFEVSDLRTPMLMASSLQKLLDMPAYNISISSSDSLSNGASSAERHISTMINYLSDGAKYSFNINESVYCRNSAGNTSNTLSQYFGNNTVYLTRTDDLTAKAITGETKTETETAIDILREYIRSAVPAVSDYDTIELSENSDSYILTFTLKKEKADAMHNSSIQKVNAIDGTFSAASEIKSQSFSGTCTIAKSGQYLSGISFSTITEYQNGIQNEILYSMMLNQTTEITVSDIIAPDYSEPELQH